MLSYRSNFPKNYMKMKTIGIIRARIFNLISSESPGIVLSTYEYIIQHKEEVPESTLDIYLSFRTILLASVLPLTRWCVEGFRETCKEDLHLDAIPEDCIELIAEFAVKEDETFFFGED